jgi:hypothetical protein
MRRGPRTEYHWELMAQGAGNAIRGLLGALPMTADRTQRGRRPGGRQDQGVPGAALRRQGGGPGPGRAVGPSGNATFLRLPKILDGLEAVPQEPVRMTSRQ